MNGKYGITTEGKVWSYRRQKFLKARYTQTGYERVHLGHNTDYYIHRLVAETFIPNPNNYKYINHKGENKSNNNIDNLEWCSIEYNNKYGTRTQKLKSNQPNKKEVVMCDKKTKEELQIFSSIREAARKTNLFQSNISRCCNSKLKNTTGGYCWKFKKGDV